jgi:hypothetical protein
MNCNATGNSVLPEIAVSVQTFPNSSANNREQPPQPLLQQHLLSEPLSERVLQQQNQRQNFPEKSKQKSIKHPNPVATSTASAAFLPPSSPPLADDADAYAVPLLFLCFSSCSTRIPFNISCRAHLSFCLRSFDPIVSSIALNESVIADLRAEFLR